MENNHPSTQKWGGKIMDSFDKKLEEILLEVCDIAADYASSAYYDHEEMLKEQLFKDAIQQIKQLIAQAPLMQDEPEPEKRGWIEDEGWYPDACRNLLRQELRDYFGLEDTK